MTEYTLYLDESYDDNTGLFCIAGCIINNTYIPIVDDEINKIKNIIWTPEEIKSFSPILHSTELNIVYKNRRNPQVSKFTRNAYTVLESKGSDGIEAIYKNVYSKLSDLIKNLEITTLCCIIDREKFKFYYSLPSSPRLLADWYDIAMQEILESYAHFLCKVKGIGSIVYEARNISATNRINSLDNKMFHNFCEVKANGKGITYLSNRTLYERIRYLNIKGKKENDSGLQLADFIAFNYIKWYHRSEEDRTDFMKRIHRAAYNGNHNLTSEDLRACWGVRILPNDVLKIQAMKSELHTLRKAYKSLKTEKNQVNKKLKRCAEEKRQLQNKLNELQTKQTKNVSG